MPEPAPPRLRLLIDACLTPAEDLARAMLDHVEAGGVLADNIFVVRRAGRLSVRRIP